MNAEFMLTAPRVTDTFVHLPSHTGSTSLTITNGDMLSSPKSEESVNPGDELSFGGCVIPTVEFEMRDPGDTGSYFTEESFEWHKNVLTERIYNEEIFSISGIDKTTMVAYNPNDPDLGGCVIVAKSVYPFLSVYDVETMSRRFVFPHLVDPVPEALVVDGTVLYSLNSTAPYVTKYLIDIANNKATKQTTPILNDFNIEQIKDMCRRKYCMFRSSSGGFYETAVEFKNEVPKAVTGQGYTQYKIGCFTSGKPEKVNGAKVRINLNGWISKFDFIVDEWLESLTYPITLKNRISGLCIEAGVEFKDSEFPNQDYPIQRNFVSVGLSALQVLRWAAELAGSFAWMDGDGKLNLGWYEPVDVTLDSSSYMSITTGEFDTLPIDRFQIRVVENDIGVIVPPNDPGNNAYVIQDNPLAYTETDAELRPAVEALYDRIDGLTYRPFELKTFQNPYIRAGNIVNVTTPGGTSFSGYVMSKSTSGGMDTLIATGNRRRELQTGDSVQQVVKQIRGSVHELEATVEGLRSTVESFDEDFVTTTTFETTVNGINLEVSKKFNSEDFDEQFSTKLRVSAEDVQIAWNAIDRTIQFVDGSLQILDTEKSEGEQLLVRFDETASHYYYNGYEVGRIGTDKFSTSDDHRGIVFQLQSDSAYMIWSVQDKEDPTTYSARMLYVNKPDEMGYPENAVYIGNLYVGPKDSMLGFRASSGGGGLVFDGVNESNAFGVSTSLGGVAMFVKQEASWAYYSLFQRYGIDFYTSLDMHDNSIFNESDERLKTNIQPTATSALQKILPMDFKQFDWIETGNHEELGLIAQQIETFFPDAVNTNETTGVKSVNTTKFVMYALKAIQELAQYMNMPALMDDNYWEDTLTLEEKETFISNLPSKVVEVANNEGVDTVKGI